MNLGEWGDYQVLGKRSKDDRIVIIYGLAFMQEDLSGGDSLI